MTETTTKHKDTLNSNPTIDYLFYFLIPFFLLLVAYHIYTFTMFMWEMPMTDHYPWRQTQTAISAREILRSGNFFHSIIPVLGPPWSVPFEFPIYQSLTALVSMIFEVSITKAGRIVSFVSFYLMLPALFLTLTKYFKVEKAIALLIIIVTIATPVNFYWSTAVLIETLALSLTIWFVLFACRTFSEKNLLNIIGIILFGSLAGLTKITTFLPILFIVGIVWIWVDCKKTISLQKATTPQISQLTLFANICKSFCWSGITYFLINIPTVIINVAWVKYADRVKSSTPWTSWLTSGGLSNHNFGGLPAIERVFKPDLFFTLLFHQITGDFWIIIGFFVIGIIFYDRRYINLAVLVSVIFVVYPLVFSNLFALHYYYWVANGTYMAVLYGLGLGLGLRIHGANINRIFVSLLSIILLSVYLFSLYDSWDNHYQNCSEIECQAGDLRQIAYKLSELTTEDELLLIFGQAWSPVIPYYADRYSLMMGPSNKSNITYAKTKVQDIESRLLDTNRKLGAIAFCDAEVNNKDDTSNIISELQALNLIKETVSLIEIGFNRCLIYDVIE